MNRRDSIQSRMRRLEFFVCAVLAAVMVIMLALLLVYDSQYRGLLHNVTTASQFNQSFKEQVDERLRLFDRDGGAAELPVAEIRAAGELSQSLLRTAGSEQSRRAIADVPALCAELEAQLRARARGAGPDLPERGAYALTARIEDAMYNYLYAEALHLTAVQRRISRQIGVEILLFMLTAAALIVVLARYSRRLRRTVTEPIAELSRRAEDVIRGDLTVREPVWSDAWEVRTLSEGMEEMIARLNAQLAASAEKQAGLRRAELALLQAQVRPHFLYNTLDTIMWLIEADRPQAAVEMVSDLSDFFRHALSRGRDVITLAEEIRHIRSYLQIQQARYQDILTYAIEVEPALGRAMIPKLTLQPLVENALYHGIKCKRTPGHIRVCSRVEGADILLEIADDGPGIPPARLDELRRSMERGERISFGLAAVHERLLLFFGPGYGLTVSSDPGAGAAVTVRIPRPADPPETGAADPPSPPAQQQ